MEIKANNVAGVRALFDRLLNQKLSSSMSFNSCRFGFLGLQVVSEKAKFVFKRALAFEKSHGDAASVAAVVARASAYVEENRIAS